MIILIFFGEMRRQLLPLESVVGPRPGPSEARPQEQKRHALVGSTPSPIAERRGGESYSSLGLSPSPNRDPADPSSC